MKSKLYLATSIVQALFGAAAVASFCVLWGTGEEVSKWIGTLIASAFCMGNGVFGIVLFCSKR